MIQGIEEFGSKFKTAFFSWPMKRRQF